MNRSTIRVGAIGATAGITLALAGGFAAQASQTDAAPTDGAAYDQAAQAALTSDPNLRGVGVGADDTVVLYTTVPASELTGAAADLAAKDNAVVTQLTAAPELYSKNDVVGGAGYIMNGPSGTYACSIGFSAWTPTGDPGFLSAGHCTSDGANTTSILSDPAKDPANGGPGWVETESLGQLEFSQFGGPGNTLGADGDNNSVDISAWKITNAALTARPAVTDWTTASTGDLYAGSTTITSVGKAKLGDTAERSGRTTGHTSGKVVAVDLWLSYDNDENNPGSDKRFVKGFATTAVSDHGDSGGAFWVGHTAVGTLTGGASDGVNEYSFAADLETSLATTGGFTVMLFIDAPVVTTAKGAEVAPGGAVKGPGPAGKTLVVTPASGDQITTKIDDSGNWSFNVPADADPDADADRDGHADADADRDGHADADADADADRHGHADADADRDGHADAHRDRDGHADPDDAADDRADRNADQDRRPGPARHRSGRPHRRRCRCAGRARRWSRPARRPPHPCGQALSNTQH
ncbi:S1 family peptidase [Microbacterium gorillae]|uniref:S1 family peptidase n=1 Tax=Microbacterium gorillae TaxID=1231063 RepID=UPI00058C2124|nr:S1 family peptidase [Microbacterium gorillae]